MITQSELKKFLHYNPETGVFTRMARTCKKFKSGTFAGTTSIRDGYSRIMINNISYMSHRLAWLYVYGSFPSKTIDHINRIRSDNRICNLREATLSENFKNQPLRVTNTTGYKGVCWRKDIGKFAATWSFKGKKKHIGVFNSAIEASIAYESFSKEHDGDFYYKLSLND